MRHRYIILIIFTLLFCISPALFSQSSDQNYIVKRVMLDKNGVSYIDKIDYFDGLGRPVQTVMKGTSPSGKDIVTLQEYDALGRAWRSWQPAPAGNSGGYVDIPSFQTAVTDFYTDAHPYSKPVYELSPLNRVKEQFGPGAAWHDNGKRVTNAWHTNNSSDKRCLSYEVTSSGGLLCMGDYPDSQLYVTEVTDEDGNKTSTFTDKLERVILTRQTESGKNHDTYYVYDAFGQLRYVLPPLASDALTSIGYVWDIRTDQSLINYAYYYKYDERGNCILKKIPGREEIRMVYDKAERLVLSQDGNQRLKNRWTVNKYDTFGRLLYTAEVLDPSSWETLLNTLKNSIIVESFSTGSHQYPMADTGYSRNYYHVAQTKLLTVNYYDDYDFLELLPSQVKSALAYKPMTDYGAQYTDAKGMLTGTRVYSLSDDTYTTEAVYYDEKANVVQRRATNRIGGYETAYNKYDFGGNILKTLKEHSATNQTDIKEYYSYTYDHASRLTKTYYKLNNLDSVLLTENIYDAIGRLTEKRRHNGKDTESFNYNLRGWTTFIKSGEFQENIYYNNSPQNINATPCYNGNIAATSWTYGNQTNGYSYTYDGLNRLKRADCYLNGASSASASMRETFVYDKMGNITSLSRFGKEGIIDHLRITYDGNRVKNRYYPQKCVILILRYN